MLRDALRQAERDAQRRRAAAATIADFGVGLGLIHLAALS